MTNQHEGKPTAENAGIAEKKIINRKLVPAKAGIENIKILLAHRSKPKIH